jgi:hypothetical protein
MAEPQIILARDLNSKGVPIISITESWTPTYSAGGVLTPLYAYTIPANGLQFNGDSIEFEFVGNFGAENGKQLTLGVSGTVALINTGVIDTLLGGYVLRGRVIRIDDETAFVFASLVTAASPLYVTSQISMDMTVENAITISGLSPTDNYVSNQLAIIDFRGKST